MLSVKPWRPETVIQFCAALFFCICFGALASGILRRLGVGGFKELDDFGNIIIGTLSFQGAAWLLAFIFLKLHHVKPGDALGFRGPQLKRALLMAVIVFIIILPTAWLLQWASVTTLTKLGWPPDHQLPVQMFENADSWWMRAYLSVFAVCLAPVAEEFIFRGVLYPCAKQVGSSRSLAVVIGLLVALRILFPLHQHLGINWFLAAGISISFGLGALYPLLKQFSTAILSVICVSVLFALIHFDAATLLPLFVLALALTWLYEKTDNLLAPILVHALFNGTNLVMLELMHLNILPDSQ